MTTAHSGDGSAHYKFSLLFNPILGKRSHTTYLLATSLICPIMMFKFHGIKENWLLILTSNVQRICVTSPLGRRLSKKLRGAFYLSQRWQPAREKNTDQSWTSLTPKQDWNWNQKLKNLHCAAPARLRQTDLDSWLVKAANDMES